MRLKSFLSASLALLLVSLYFTGCFGTDEEVVINPDGSGVYTISLDMNSAMSMMTMMRAADTSSEKKERIAVRNDVSLADLIEDYAISASERRMMGAGLFRIVMNEDSSLFSMTIQCPFPSLKELPTIRGISRMMLADPDILKGMQQAVSGEASNEDAGSKEMMDILFPATNHFSYTTTPNSIYSGISSSTKFMQSADYDSLKSRLDGEGGIMFKDTRYNITIRTPQPITYSIGPSMQLSRDKKEVKFTYTADSLVRIPTCAGFEVRFK